jgi:hypothetical protein
MAIEYFSNFPDILYRNQVAKNILLRAALREVTKKNTSVLLPITLEFGERPDMIAHDLYKNSSYDWLVKFSTNTVDPYFDWPLTDDNFNKFIQKKYGSIPAAQATILHYEHNTEDVKINKTTYDLLSGAEQANYTVVYAYDYLVAQNEAKLITTLIAPDFASIIDRELEKKLNE